MPAGVLSWDKVEDEDEVEAKVEVEVKVKDKVEVLMGGSESGSRAPFRDKTRAGVPVPRPVTFVRPVAQTRP